MTRRELNIAIFEGTTDKVLWQPRLETWLKHHRRNGTFPDGLKNKSDLEIYDSLGCSVRYPSALGMGDYYHSIGLEQYSSGDIKRVEKQENGYFISTDITPVGELKTIYQDVYEEGNRVNRRIVEFPVKKAEDIKVLNYITEHEQFRSDIDVFNNVSDKIGKRGEPTIFLSSSGFTGLIKWYSGLEDTFYILADNPEVIEEHLEICDARDDRMINEALKLPCKIFNLGDHAIDEFTPPTILEKYLLPRWQRIGKTLRKHNRYVHTHWDGNAKTILKFLKHTELSGVEALPPLPMGNITLEEIKEAVGDKMVVLDLIPAIHFLPSYKLDEVLEFTRKVIDMFAPKLILGVSDEISEVGQIEKIEAISKLVDSICGLAE